MLNTLKKKKKLYFLGTFLPLCFLLQFLVDIFSLPASSRCGLLAFAMFTLEMAIIQAKTRCLISVLSVKSCRILLGTLFFWKPLGKYLTKYLSTGIL